MTDSSAFLTVTSASPDSPVWAGAVATAALAILAVLAWSRLSRTPLASPRTSVVAAVATLIWGVAAWATLPATPTVRDAVGTAFGVTLDDDPSRTHVADGAKLTGTAGPDRATCFMTPSPVDRPKRTFDTARWTFAVAGTVVVTCTAGPPPPELDDPGFTAPPAPGP